jgi:hypothetical protein
MPASNRVMQLTLSIRIVAAADSKADLQTAAVKLSPIDGL